MNTMVIQPNIDILKKEFIDDIRKCVDDFNTKWEE